MNIDFENITAVINIGDPFKFNNAFGRIVGFDLDSTKSPEGQYPIVLWGTPHGNVIRTGRCYITRITTEEDMQKLKEFEQDAIENGIVPYDGKVVLE